MKLFFVSPLNQDTDANEDWFVVADDAKEAWKLYMTEPATAREFEEEDDAPSVPNLFGRCRQTPIFVERHEDDWCREWRDSISGEPGR